jgi:hypothetical protein
MSVPAEFSQEFAKFPPPLQQLVEAELQAGNAVVAIEHGFPAAPCGASVKLARAVKDERRKSTGEVKFYARNNSDYAGEFTTEPRHFFVLEPPLPPEPAPDMDAIRAAAQGKPDAMTQFAQTREPGAGVTIVRDRLLGRSSLPPPAKDRRPSRALTSTETATDAIRLLHFIDRRPPHEIQFELERQLMTLFAPTLEHERLVLRAQATVVGGRYFFELRFEAALLQKNHYSLRVETSWAGHAATHHDYYRKTSDSWFSLWTRDFMAANPPRAGAGSPARYRQLCEAALHAEQHLDTVPAIQKAILDAMKRGASFSTSHKEGGTNIYWGNGTYVRTDYGEYPDQKQFPGDEDFLKFLRQFHDGETSRNIYPNKVPELVAWKLILRLLRTS